MNIVIASFLPFMKAKYRKRTGSPGKYKYFYGPEGREGPKKTLAERAQAIQKKGGKAERKKLSRTALIRQGKSFGQTAKMTQVRKDIAKMAGQKPSTLPSALLGPLAQAMKRDQADQSADWLGGFIGGSGDAAKGIFAEMQERGLVGGGKTKGKVSADDLVERGVSEKEAKEFIQDHGDRIKGMTADEAHEHFKAYKKASGKTQAGVGRKLTRGKKDVKKEEKSPAQEEGTAKRQSVEEHRRKGTQLHTPKQYYDDFQASAGGKKIIAQARKKFKDQSPEAAEYGETYFEYVVDRMQDYYDEAGYPMPEDDDDFYEDMYNKVDAGQ